MKKLKQFEIKIKFKPHQQRVIDYVKNKNPKGILLYHGLGSGKTITSLGIAELYKKPVVCIVPASVRPQWKLEIKKVGVWKRKYIIFSYQTFVKQITRKSVLNDAIVIIDEAHRIRNDNPTTRHIQKMTQNAHKIILLTGTPMVNHPVDFSNLANTIKRRAVLETIQTTFDHKYNIKRNENKNKNKQNENKNKLDLESYASKVSCITSYHFPKLSSFYPKRTNERLTVKMSQKQNNDYQKALQLLNENDRIKLEKGEEINSDKGKFHEFLTKARKISNVSVSDKKESTPKLEAILRFVKKGPKPVVIYSSFLFCGIKPMARLLEKHNIKYKKFTGSLNDSGKKKVVMSYNNGEIDVLLLSSSGSEGLDLKGTRQIHIMEPHWNMAKTNQVIGRGIRYKSHTHLPVSKQLVNVYFWLSIPISFSKTDKNKKNKKKGADQYIYQINDNKSKLIENFAKVLMKTSIESEICQLKPQFRKKILSKIF